MSEIDWTFDVVELHCAADGDNDDGHGTLATRKSNLVFGLVRSDLFVRYLWTGPGCRPG